MTEEQKYELATLASDAQSKRLVLDCHMIMNVPRDPGEAEKAYIQLKIAETEWMEAQAKLDAFQRRVSNF